jgi:hypothetical protein
MHHTQKYLEDEDFSVLDDKLHREHVILSVVGTQSAFDALDQLLDGGEGTGVARLQFLLSHRKCK